MRMAAPPRWLVGAPKWLLGFIAGIAATILSTWLLDTWRDRLRLRELRVQAHTRTEFASAQCHKLGANSPMLQDSAGIPSLLGVAADLASLDDRLSHRIYGTARLLTRGPIGGTIILQSRSPDGRDSSVRTFASADTQYFATIGPVGLIRTDSQRPAWGHGGVTLAYQGKAIHVLSADSTARAMFCLAMDSLTAMLSRRLGLP